LERVCSTLEQETRQLEHPDKHQKWLSREEHDVRHSFEHDDGYEMEM
jgi:hypothetical protein